ncbi:hypothetical protein BYI23_A020670 [Burkholderia sp. YI23]|nr:hypothetical protein BYI23_A020670 [Burkholderia sp. YI23]
MRLTHYKALAVGIIVFAACAVCYLKDPLLLIDRDRFDYYSESIVECTMLRPVSAASTDKLGLGFYEPKEKCRSQFSDTSIPKVAPADMINLTDANWNRGVSRQFPGFLVENTFWNIKKFMPGQRIRVPGGLMETIQELSVNNQFIAVHLDGPKIDIDRTTASAPSAGDLRPYTPYEKQLGGPGFIFGFLHRVFNNNDVNFYRAFNIGLLSLCFAIFCSFVTAEFGAFVALSLGVVFITSPWLINIAGNLYWMSWTWYAPTALTLWFASHPRGKNLRGWSNAAIYAAYFGLIAFKSASGYEYLPTILITSILPIIYVYVRDGIAPREVSRCILKFGVTGIAAFVSILMMHAYLRSGSIVLGLQEIATDVTRRTYAFGDDVQGALGNGASLIVVIRMYFGQLLQPIIIGVTAPFFTTLSALIAASMILSQIGGKKEKAIALSFFASVFAPISWFVTAKGHSFVHPHINGVLWDLPTVPLGVIVVSALLARTFDYARDRIRSL